MIEDKYKNPYVWSSMSANISVTILRWNNVIKSGLFELKYNGRSKNALTTSLRT